MFDNWLVRHKDKRSLILHAAGIPLTIVAIPALIVASLRESNWLYLPAAAAFVIGYALQFVGHAIEGNDAGEMILIKKLLGRPYKAVANHDEKEPGNERSS